MPVHLDPPGGAPLPIIDIGNRPRRVVFIGVDAGRYDYLDRFRVPNIGRLIDRGVCFRNAVCGNFISETAPGFASLSTGVYPKTHGICTSYEWFDRKSEKPQYFYDEQTGQLRLDAPSLGELWKRSVPGLKIAAVSTKDRPSLLLAGPAADTVVYCYNELLTVRELGDHYKGPGVHAEYLLGRSAQDGKYRPISPASVFRAAATGSRAASSTPTKTSPTCLQSTAISWTPPCRYSTRRSPTCSS